MKYIGMPMGMWVLFGKSFEHNLIMEFGLDRNTAKTADSSGGPYCDCGYKKKQRESTLF